MVFWNGCWETNLCFARLPFMARNADLVEEAMELPNNCPYLRGKVAGIHGEPAHST